MIPILTYHQIEDPAPKGTPFRSLRVAPDRFESHMKWLHRLGWQGLSMSELMPYLKGERLGKVFGITFDDGYLNNLEFALPVLNDLGFSATCYLVHDLIGRTNSWDRSLGIEEVALMDVSEIQEWIQGGMEVGSHTLSHAHLSTLSESEAWSEIEGSKKALEDRLGLPIAHFCYPYGEFTKVHSSMAQRAGYVSATTTQRGRASLKANPWTLPRVPVHRSSSTPQLLWKMMTRHEDRHLHSE